MPKRYKLFTAPECKPCGELLACLTTEQLADIEVVSNADYEGLGEFAFCNIFSTPTLLVEETGREVNGAEAIKAFFKEDGDE